MTAKFEDELLAQARAQLDTYTSIKELNEFLESKTGIIEFFKSTRDFEEYKQFLNIYRFPFAEEESEDLGDFQTPYHLTDMICKRLAETGFAPDTMIEPTCGEGNFIVSAIEYFPSLRYVYCVDAQSKYEWLLKLNLLNLSLQRITNVKVEFHRDNIFVHQTSDKFIQVLDSYTKNLLILGNPPWVMSSKLSMLESNNLPFKTNIKGYRGIEAITGKGDFDIAEYIILQMAKQYSRRKGKIAMLCKTSVIKNIVRDMRKLSLALSNINALLIDAKREFNINADAALFLADIGYGQGDFCTVSSLYQPDRQVKRFGWINNRFVSDVETYQKYRIIDGESPFVWRTGVKHDAAKIMVLRIISNGKLSNGLKEHVDIEWDILYPFIRGSDLKKPVVSKSANRIIMTQTSLSEDTEYIAFKCPKLWEYLVSHSESFDKRKSQVYKRGQRFAIFGVGDYSFRPYKIAISGLYKTPSFSLILPIEGKPVMLDDTCYYLSFDAFNTAFFTWILLNTNDVKKFLSAIVFLDSKRPYTKEMLMRIDVRKLSQNMSFDALVTTYRDYFETYLEHEFNEKDFIDYQNSLKSMR